MKNELTDRFLVRWNLQDLFPAPDSSELEAAFAALESLVADFEALRSQLSDTTDSRAFLQLVEKLEEIRILERKLNCYAYLYFTDDTQNQAALGLLSRVKQFTAGIANRVLFFELWWKSLGDASAIRLIDVAGAYHPWLETLRTARGHTLGEVEEKIINVKNVTGRQALNTLYDTITNHYTFAITLDGEKKSLSRGELIGYVRHPRAAVREAAYREQFRVYGNDGLILGQIYQALVRDWHNEQVNLRKFTRPIAARNAANNLPDGIVDTLLEVVQKNTGILQRFFRLKARRMGVQCLSRYDIYAPTTQSEKSYSFEEAVGHVLETFRQFDPHFEQLALRVINENHLDCEARQGKNSLPFCYAPGSKVTPYVNIHFQGRVIDVSTLAHELGHAIHAMLACENTAFTANPSLPLAETASTFSELLLMDHLLACETGADIRSDLLFGQVEHAYTSIQRQAFSALFECQAHLMVQQGASVDDLAVAYLAMLKTQFADAVEVGDEFRWEWVTIPHIYDVPFYVYAYSFGQLVVLALYEQYRQEGEGFKSRYAHLLSAGGSRSPADLLASVGIDARQASFWQGGFNIIESQVKELERLSGAVPFR